MRFAINIPNLADFADPRAVAETSRIVRPDSARSRARGGIQADTVLA
jgi:hypothetical protein